MEEKHSARRFLIMVGGSIIVAFILVVISISLYFSSGTAQVDLSRPGYQSVRDQAKSEDTFKGFPASGVIDDKTLDEFNKMYQDKAKEATSVDAFSSEVLSDTSLEIDDVPVQ